MQSLTGKPVPKSYWSYALEYCRLEPTEVITSWSKLLPTTGEALVLCWVMIESQNMCSFFSLPYVSSVSRRNAALECGLGINKKQLQAHGNSILGETIVSVSWSLCNNTYITLILVFAGFYLFYALHFCKIGCCCYVNF